MNGAVRSERNRSCVVASCTLNSGASAMPDIRWHPLRLPAVLLAERYLHEPVQDRRHKKRIALIRSLMAREAARKRSWQPTTGSTATCKA
jgi:hypothetical protein